MIETFVTHAPEETEALGRALAGLLPEGAVLALQGDLAAGKTCLVRGMSAVLAPGAAVSSPTFTLVNEYGDPPRVYHLDLYRLEGPGELIDLGFEELVQGDGVCVIEWAERAEGCLPDGHVQIDLAHAGGDARSLQIASNGALGDGWGGVLRASIST